ncbi:MAG TPA: hypothetical protein VEB22_05450 [Phycisphaerales bacterium]|nr:hypothetical protein [Phycisphaerales bacterium]
MKTRPMIAAAACLLAGLLTQTLVAWTLFIRSDYTGGTGVLNDPPLKAGERTTTGFVVPADWSSRTRVEWWGMGKTRETVSECVWMASALGMTSDGGRQATYNGFSAGWPLRSFHGCDYLSPGVVTQTPSPLADIPEWVKPGGFKVPVGPRWWGLLGNTLFYATPFAAVWSVVYFRREARRRAGHCLRCGYNAAGLEKCPECGVPRALRKGAG